MRRTLLLFTLITMSLSVAKVRAQSCITFQPDFSDYVDESTDGSRIYTSVEIEGTGNMIVNNPGSPNCPPTGSSVHTAYSENYLSSTGGWSSGNSGCPDCYLSSTNDQSIAAIPGKDYSFNWDVNVICSVAGTIFGDGGFITLALVTTYGELNGQLRTNYDTLCIYKTACTNPSSTVPTCGGSGQNDLRPANVTCWQYARSSYIALKVGGVTACSPGVFFPASGPGPCN